MAIIIWQLKCAWQASRVILQLLVQNDCSET